MWLLCYADSDRFNGHFRNIRPRNLISYKFVLDSRDGESSVNIVLRKKKYTNVTKLVRGKHIEHFMSNINPSAKTATSEQALVVRWLCLHYPRGWKKRKKKILSFHYVRFSHFQRGRDHRGKFSPLAIENAFGVCCLKVRIFFTAIIIGHRQYGDPACGILSIFFEISWSH